MQCGGMTLGHGRAIDFHAHDAVLTFVDIVHRHIGHVRREVVPCAPTYDVLQQLSEQMLGAAGAGLRGFAGRVRDESRAAIETVPKRLDRAARMW